MRFAVAWWCCAFSLGWGWTGAALGHTLAAHSSSSIDGTLEGRLCGGHAAPAQLVVDEAAGIVVPTALRLGAALWLPIERGERIGGFPATERATAGQVSRRADGTFVATLELESPDCMATASLAFEGTAESRFDSTDVVRGVETTASMGEAIAARRVGRVLESRSKLAAASVGDRPAVSSRWARLHLVRAHVELGEFDEAHSVFERAGKLRAFAHEGLDAYAALLDARLAGTRGAFEASLASRKALGPRLAALHGTRGEDYVANEVYLAAAENFLGEADVAASRLRAVKGEVETLSPADPLRVDAVLVESQILTSSNESAEAERLVADELSRQAQRDGEMTFAQAQLARELGALRVGDRPLEGLPAMRRAAAWYVRNLGEASAWTLLAEEILAALQAHAGRVDEAIATQRRVVVNYGRRYGARDVRSIVSMHALANYLFKARRWREGVDVLLPTIALADSLGDPLVAHRAHMRIDLGSALWDLEGPAASCRVVGEARSLADRADIGEHQRLDLETVAAACMVRRDAAAGLHRLEQLRDERVTRFGLDSRSAIFGRAALARQLMHEGALDRATAELERMSETLERLRNVDLPEAGGGRAMFTDWLESDTLYAGYRDLAWLYYRQRRMPEAVRTAEATRGRTVDDTLGLRQRVETLAPTEQAKARAIAARMRELEAETSLLPAGSGERAGLDAERSTLASTLDVLVASGGGAGPASIDALRRSLPAGTAYVGIQLLRDTAWAFVLRRDRAMRVVALPRLPDWIGAVRPVLAALSQPVATPPKLWRLASGDYVLGLVRPAEDAEGATVESTLRSLGAALLDPLSPHLKGVRQLVVAADAPLSAVPLELFEYGGRPLPERFEVAIAPSLASWVALRTRRARAYQLDLVAVGAPDYGALLAPPPLARPAAVPLQWKPLPAAADEVRSIASQFPSRRTRILDARHDLLAAAARRGTLDQARFVHVAAHAYLSTTEPGWSSLVLKGTGSQVAYLTAAELATYAISSELVVLSACETGLGREVPGEGLFGLPYAIVVAGARGAVLALWPIADDATAEFMKRFYAKLARGQRPALALAATKREFMRHPQWSAPFYWAPFVLYGAG